MTGVSGELLNHVWQSTLCAGVVGLLAIVMRTNSAAIRYRLWLAASLKFLIPFSLFVYAGSAVGWPGAPAPAPIAPLAPIQLTAVSSAGTAPHTAASTSVVDVIAEPLAMATPLAAPATAMSLPFGSFDGILIGALGIWFIGFAFNVVSWVREWMRARRRLRAAVHLEVDVPARIPAMSSPGAIEPSVFGILRPVLLLPEGILDDLTPAQVESILLHESAHVDRRDNLAAAIHMAVETIFWFNPAVWWIGRRLVDERERACDEAVLRGFEEPDTYAEAILSVCKLHLKTPLVCAAGVASSNLRERIETIMNYQRPEVLNAPRKLLLAIVAVAAACGPISAGIVSARQLAAPQPAFAFSLIAPPGAMSATARGINSVGYIVGSFVDGTGTHGFLYRNGAFTTLDVPGSAWTMAAGINNAGQIVGAHGTGAEVGNHGFLLSGGNFASFDVPGSLDTIASGINNKGQIVGTYLGSDGLRHGFRLSGGTYALIEAPESGAGSAEGINDSGHIVGVSGDGAAATAYVLTGSTYSRIPTETNTFVVARDVNNLGDIVGQDGGPLAPYRGFLRTGGTYSPLPAPGGAFSWNVHGLNDLGQLVGEFTDGSGRTFGYLATPSVFTAPPAAADPSAASTVAFLDHTPTPVAPAAPAAQGPPGPEGPPGPPGPGAPARGPASQRNVSLLAPTHDALSRALNGMRRAVNQSEYVQQAIAGTVVAIDDVAAAMRFLEERPEQTALPGSHTEIVRFMPPPRPAPRRNAGLEIALNHLNTALDALARTPGGDIGGWRPKINADITTAAQDLIEAMVKANDQFVRSRRGANEGEVAPEPAIDGPTSAGGTAGR